MAKKLSDTNVQPSATKTWDALAVASQKGDKRSYAQLLQEIASYTKNYIYRSLANPEWVEDITQDVLLSVHKSLNTYSGDRPFKPWLCAIINFRRTDYLRKHYSRREHQQVSTDNADFLTQHVTNPAHMGEYKDIETALDSLSAKQRKVFEMLKIQGYSAKEVANELGMSVSAVKVSVHRSTSKLKDILQ